MNRNLILTALKILLVMMAELTICFSQTSNVTATITDPDGQTWNSGTFSIVFIPTPGVPGPFTWSGGTNFPVKFSGTMSTSGVLTASIPDNSFITPAGSKWQFTLCGNTSAPCQNVVQSAIGASPNLSTQLSTPLIAPRFSPGPNAFGYLDLEVIGPPAPGATYWNVTSTSQRIWNGSAWITAGGGPFSSVTAGTNTSALLIGTGGSLDVTGTGVINASLASSLNNNGWYLSQNCRNAPNCTQIHGDLKYVIDASTTNGSSVVTCPNSDCNFVAGDVGKTVWATSQGSGVGTGYLLFTTYACPISTIQTVNSAQSITLAAANDCIASLTATAALYWGTKDGAALASLDAAAGCAVIHVPSNIFILDDQPFLVNAPASGQCGGGTTLANGITSGIGQPAPTLVGDGASAPQAVFVVSPDFNWANCKAITNSSQNVCVGGTARAIANVSFWGTGLSAASNGGCAGAANKNFMATSPVASNDIGIVIAGICPGATGMRGFESDSTDQNFEIGAVISTGQFACAAHFGHSMVFRELDCRNENVSSGFGLTVDSGAQLLDISSEPIVGAQIAGDYQSRGTHFSSNANSAGVTVTSGGVWTSYGDYVGTDPALGTNSNALIVNSGGSVVTFKTAFKGNGLVAINNSGSITSLGGNQIVSSVLNTNSGSSISGSGILVGTCRGTATSSATLGLYGLGQFSTPACTSTTVNQGVAVTVVPLTGSIISLAVNAGTGCKSGNTCVFTVMKNNAANPSTPVATNLTCSMTGGASFCADNAHFDIPVAGDTYSIQFTTGATETLANVTATLINW